MLSSYGWTDRLQHEFADHARHGLVAARVIVQHRARYVLMGEAGEFSAEASGRLLHHALATDLPVVGDWVAVTPLAGDGVASIQAVLPRHSQFVRRAAGSVEKPQVVAANFDVVLLTTGLDADFNLRRIERYLTAARRTGADVVVVLTKADLCEDLDARLQEVRTVALDVPVIAVSAPSGHGVDAVRAALGPGRTGVLLGMSGVGKSTLVNALMGADRQAVGEVRAIDGRGRHTTTHRELILTPDGGLILDTPGMRELGLWDPGEGAAAETFEDIETLALSCRFRNCTHTREPGCAVQAAIAGGELSADRLDSYRKLEREAAYFERKEDPTAAQAHKKLWAGRAKLNRRRRQAEDQDD